MIHIIEPAAGNRIVTAIEVMSPDNKRPGPGREFFLRKRAELSRAGAHLVEIDLLRDGERGLEIVPDEAQGKIVDVSRWHYVVTVTRRPRYCEYYPATVHERLPRVGPDEVVRRIHLEPGRQVDRIDAGDGHAHDPCKRPEVVPARDNDAYLGKAARLNGSAFFTVNMLPDNIQLYHVGDDLKKYVEANVPVPLVNENRDGSSPFVKAPAWVRRAAGKEAERLAAFLDRTLSLAWKS